MAASGDSAEAVRSTLTLSVETHPERYRWDRVSIVTGLVTWPELIFWMNCEVDVA